MVILTTMRWLSTISLCLMAFGIIGSSIHIDYAMPTGFKVFMWVMGAGQLCALCFVHPVIVRVAIEVWND